MRPTKEQLQSWARRIHANATAHGWHEEEKPGYHWLGMVMTEVAEAIEADRKGRRFSEEAKEKYLAVTTDSEGYHVTVAIMKMAYEDFVKGTVEEEFADICIRILDTAYELHRENMNWYGGEYQPCTRSFTVQAFVLVKEILNTGMMNLTEAIYYMFAWAERLGIDLAWHIEQKMVYNELRSYKHGGKAY